MNMIAHNNKSIDKCPVLTVKKRKAIDNDLFGSIRLQYMFPVINSRSKVLRMILDYFHVLKIIRIGRFIYAGVFVGDNTNKG